MNRIQTKMSEVDRTFNVKFNSNSNFKVKLDKTSSSSSIPVQFEKSQSSFNTLIDKSDNSIDAKSDLNNKPEEDTWYDEVIFYDGGGVDGYGY